MTKYKQNTVTINFDPSEYHLFSPKLLDLVGEGMKTFRAELLKSKVSPNFKDLKKAYDFTRISKEESLEHG